MKKHERRSTLFKFKIERLKYIVHGLNFFMKKRERRSNYTFFYLKNIILRINTVTHINEK